MSKTYNPYDNVLKTVKDAADILGYSESDIEAITGARILADMESSCFKKVCCNVYLTEF